MLAVPPEEGATFGFFYDDECTADTLLGTVTVSAMLLRGPERARRRLTFFCCVQIGDESMDRPFRALLARVQQEMDTQYEEFDPARMVLTYVVYAMREREPFGNFDDFGD
jgi:hypothetical protein